MLLSSSIFINRHVIIAWWSAVLFSQYLYLWDTVICRKSKLVIRRLMFIVRLPCLETFDKQRVATAEKRCWRILWELAKIIPHSAQLPCENASPHWLIFHRQNERLPYGPGDELHQSTFLMGNLDGAGEKGEQAPATNCLHCQLVRVPFFSLCCCCCWRKRVGGFILLGGGYFVFCETFGNPPR